MKYPRYKIEPDLIAGELIYYIYRKRSWFHSWWCISAKDTLEEAKQGIEKDKEVRERQKENFIKTKKFRKENPSIYV